MYTLSDILVSCHKSTYDLLFCLYVVIFFPPDGCFLKQSAGPSGVFSVFSFFFFCGWCHSGRFVNLGWSLCAAMILLAEISADVATGEVKGEGGKKGMEGGKDQVNCSSRVTSISQRPHR